MSKFDPQNFSARLSAVELCISKAKHLPDGDEKQKEINEIKKIVEQLKIDKSIWKHDLQTKNISIEQKEHEERKKEEELIKNLEQELQSF